MVHPEIEQEIEELEELIVVLSRDGRNSNMIVELQQEIERLKKLIND